MKLWLANKIIETLYAVFAWSVKVRMQAEADQPVFFFTPIEHDTQDHSRMN